MNKTKYLATMFNKRTRKKNYENYIVNAIYTLIGNKELIPVTQQYVQLDDKKSAFLDLYFPQINYGIEIDERHHLNKFNKWNDKERAMAIASAIKCKEGRIAIYSAPKKLREYEDIYKDILREVDKIKVLIKKQRKLVWKDNEQLKKEVFKRKYFDIKDQVDYAGITEIYNALHHNVKSLRRCYVKLNEQYRLWVPFLAIKLGKKVITKNGWENYINEDMTEIVEIPKDKNQHKDTKNLESGPWKDNGIKRVVFMQMKDRFGETCKKFLGVFEADRVEHRGKKQYRYYKRIAETVDFKGLYPSSNKKNRKRK